MEDFIKKIDSHAKEIFRRDGSSNAAKFVSQIRQVYLKGANHERGRKVLPSEMTYARDNFNLDNLFGEATRIGKEHSESGQDIYQVTAPLSNLESRYLGKHLTAPRTGLVSKQF